MHRSKMSEEKKKTTTQLKKANTTQEVQVQAEGKVDNKQGQHQRLTEKLTTTFDNLAMHEPPITTNKTMFIDSKKIVQ